MIQMAAVYISQVAVLAQCGCAAHSEQDACTNNSLVERHADLSTTGQRRVCPALLAYAHLKPAPALRRLHTGVFTLTSSHRHLHTRHTERALRRPLADVASEGRAAVPPPVRVRHAARPLRHRRSHVKPLELQAAYRALDLLHGPLCVHLLPQRHEALGLVHWHRRGAPCALRSHGVAAPAAGGQSPQSQRRGSWQASHSRTTRRGSGRTPKPTRTARPAVRCSSGVAMAAQVPAGFHAASR
eukprot:6197045-Pleurochrysis_carterae.AAC.3